MQYLRNGLAIPLLASLAVSGHARAWEDHSLGSYVALGQLKELSEAPDAQAETLEVFLKAERQGIEELLDSEESWARREVPQYPARPDYLRFEAGVADKDLRCRFLQALRLNPGMKLALALQQLPGQDLSPRPRIDPKSVTTLSVTPDYRQGVFVGLGEGESARALDVVSSASDEPDYGSDVGLWQDSGTWYGAIDGFGKLPFGNPTVEFSTQSPFHMGFYHEAGIIYAAAGFLRRTYPEMRIHQCLSLARFAFRTGHAYWSWRFTGWGLHYVQDLTQPYHSTVLPGVSVAKMLWINGLDMIGIHGPKNDRIQLVTNRHFALENYEFGVLTGALAKRDPESPALRALADEASDGRIGEFRDSSPRDVVSERSHEQADRADEAIRQALPEKWVKDPKYLFGTTEPGVDVRAWLESGGTEESRASMGALLRDLMLEFGMHSRSFVRAVLAE